jgi:hypothetical protein
MRPLRACGLLLALLATAALMAGGTGRAQEKKKTKPPDKTGKTGKGFADLGDLNAEVTVLQVLNSLQATPAQLSYLAKAAPKTMQEAPPRKAVKVSPKFRKALIAMRDALVGGDEDAISEASAELDDLRSADEPEFDDVEVTNEARTRAPLALRQFNARQVALYVGGLDDFPDPVERLREALSESQKRKGKDWMSYRDDVAYQVGWLVAGLDTAAEQKVRDKVTKLLNSAAKLGEKEYAAKRAELNKEARAILGKLGPTDVIRHFMERLLAETLSNHRLAAAVAARQKKRED